MKWYNESTEIA